MTEAVWDASAPGTLVVSGHLGGEAARRPVALRAEEDSGRVREAPLSYGPDGGRGFTARMPLARLRPGRRTLTLRTNTVGTPIPVPHTDRLGGTRWFRASRPGRPACAKPLPRPPEAS
ncbi:hypothetical protein [Streptomyces djakartensis]|uniref:hypothetical protein n=1 Tax=Streptomyces djakartensis TaxID=68193 RepID=UPI0034DE78C7